MILITQLVESGREVARLEGDELLEYAACAEAHGFADLPRLLDELQLKPPGRYEIHRSARTFSTVIIPDHNLKG